MGALDWWMVPEVIRRVPFPRRGEWFRALVLASQGKNIFACTHQGVRNTVIAMGDNEGEGFRGGTSGIPERRG